MQLTLGGISKALAIASPAEAERSVAGYSIDSRTVRPGELFFAVSGERLDGHAFVLQALQAGAAAAVVDSSRVREFPSSAHSKLLPVPDTLLALQKLAAEVRRRWGGPVVAVTGSAGKTTTKQTIANLLATRFRVLQSEGNLNNHFGLPLSLLRLTPETEVGVFELGMSAAGEIRLLAELAGPDVGVVTNVSAVHLEFFPDVDAIARAKYELIEGLPSDGWAVLNEDDERVRSFGRNMPGRVLNYGIYHHASFQARDLQPDGEGGVNFTVRAAASGVPLGALRNGTFAPPESERAVSSAESPDQRFHLSLLGRHNVSNVLAALAVCYLFGIPPASLKDAVAALRPGRMRGEVVRLSNGALAVNDCYNSNPEALEMMLVSLKSLPARRRFAVLGGMMELGPTSSLRHQQAGRRIPELGFDGLLTVGDAARGFAEGAIAAGMRLAEVMQFERPEDAGAKLREMLQPGDVVLLKASRSVHLEKAWQELEPLMVPAKVV